MIGLKVVRPGSALWLIQHELRLAWRGMSGKKGINLLPLLLLAMNLALHAWMYPLLRDWPAAATPPWMIFVLGGAAWLCLSLMLSQAIWESLTALFDRGDLDLLLASPLPTRSVFIARGLGIVLSVVAMSLFMLAPLANLGLFTGHANLLAIYPTLLALALGVTALGMWLTLLLVRVLGARRARTVAQVLGSLVGALLFLALEAYRVMGAEQRQQWSVRLMRLIASDGPLSVDSPLWLLGRALLGELWPLMTVVVLGVGAFWAVVGFAHQRFLAGTQESVTGSAKRGLAARSAGSVRFRAGLLRNVLVKEWRLILRDPQLIAQTLLQLLYLLPMLILALRSEGQSTFLLMPAVVWLASSLASGLAWITVAAEDAPDLLGGAPIALTRLRWIKLLAALLPVWLLVSPLLVYLLGISPRQALIFTFCLVGATLLVGLGQIWCPRQGKRTEMKTRMEGNIMIGILEALQKMGWGGLTYCLSASEFKYAPMPLLVVLLGAGAIWLVGRARRADGASI